MANQVNVYSQLPLPRDLLKLLEAHLPGSLPLLRRIQFASKNGNKAGYFKVILVNQHADGSSARGSQQLEDVDDGHFVDDLGTNSVNVPFTMACVEFGPRPDTQLWIYSTFEDVSDDKLEAEATLYRSQLHDLVRQLRLERQNYGGENAFGQSVLLGSAHNPRVMTLLKEFNRYSPEQAGTYDKWLFRIESLPGQMTLPDGLAWATAEEEDCRVAISHATVPLPLETLMHAPSVFIKSQDATPVCWGFLAPDGSLIYLHCKETHRQKGLARALVTKLFREKVPEFGGDGWASADVHPDNTASRALCKSLGGKPLWLSSWVLFDLSPE